MVKSYSIDSFNDLAALAGLLIKFGGEFPLFPERRRIWLRAKVNWVSALGADPPASDVFEPTEDYFLDMAMLAAKLEKQLIKHARPW